MACPSACTNPPSPYALLRRNTVFKARTEFQVVNPGRKRAIPSYKQKNKQQKNTNTYSMPLLVIHHKIKLCDV